MNLCKDILESDAIVDFKTSVLMEIGREIRRLRKSAERMVDIKEGRSNQFHDSENKIIEDEN